MKKNKDYIYALILVLTHFFLWYYFAYIKYDGIEVKDYKYILGLPEWFFYSTIVTSIFIIIAIIFVCNYLFNKDIKEEENDKYR
ncbi:YhdT family protein [Gemelliphila palaticanis]|uniref:DUF997 family protein n=1 Tax=Gemelliphila palaticanis TaxID=81950 RepID=A0ABX2T2Y2_9BACL|nr:YhdT family protein [Gemella palaticanis]MBF0715645.1 DUF997 family protein [Gemella palaticanis]NYS47575.1 DUF997 family protein [Gemella palaticanis]